MSKPKYSSAPFPTPQHPLLPLPALRGPKDSQLRGVFPDDDNDSSESDSSKGTQQANKTESDLAKLALDIGLKNLNMGGKCVDICWVVSHGKVMGMYEDHEEVQKINDGFFTAKIRGFPTFKAARGAWDHAWRNEKIAFRASGLSSANDDDANSRIQLYWVVIKGATPGIHMNHADAMVAVGEDNPYLLRVMWSLKDAYKVQSWGVSCGLVKCPYLNLCESIISLFPLPPPSSWPASSSLNIYMSMAETRTQHHGRPQKYETDEERRVARVSTQARYYESNHLEIKDARNPPTSSLNVNGQENRNMQYHHPRKKPKLSPKAASCACLLRQIKLRCGELMVLTGNNPAKFIGHACSEYLCTEEENIAKLEEALANVEKLYDYANEDLQNLYAESGASPIFHEGEDLVSRLADLKQQMQDVVVNAIVGHIEFSTISIGIPQLFSSYFIMGRESASSRKICANFKNAGSGMAMTYRSQAQISRKKKEAAALQATVKRLSIALVGYLDLSKSKGFSNKRSNRCCWASRQSLCSKQKPFTTHPLKPQDLNLRAQASKPIVDPQGLNLYDPETQ
ncbi:hypothetical protein ARMSODRAFT_975861 [Armillaria solidipes]|uniref:Uncharacterized protein n=1 Tax=Armillaria solidipes TaxID=1076256 RepID=A0A2H3BC69_9AGAR|nr:hypothetical protein ARMSODRAFT_975861 [Armillaria solidipes]